MLQEFYKPNSIAEVVGLKSRLGEDAYYFAGGTELNSLDFKKTFKYAICIEKLSLNKIKILDDIISIGASVTLQELINNKNIPAQLKQAAAHIINRNIRNIGTIAGNIGANKSCSNLMPVLLALDAELTVATITGETNIRLLDYISAENKEFILSVNIKKENLKKCYSIKKYSRTANDISIITVAVVLEKTADKIKNINIALGGAAKHTIRLTELETKLTDNDKPSKESIENFVSASIAPVSDVRGSAEFKKYMAGALTADCIIEAFDKGGAN